MSEAQDFSVELAALLGRLADEELTSDDARRLEQILSQSDAARNTFLEFIALHVQLELEHSLQESKLLSSLSEALLNDDNSHPATARQSQKDGPYQAVTRFFTRPRPVSLAVATLVIGLLVTAMAFMAPPFYRAIVGKDGDSPTESRIVAQLTGLNDAIWAEGQTATHQGAYLQEGKRLKLVSGLAEVTFSAGTRVTIEGPVEFILDNSNGLTLDSGTIVASVPSPAKGFCVQTPLGAIVDLGTEFGVSVKNPPSIAVHVFEGQVALEKSEYVNRRQVVQAGQMARVTPGSGTKISRLVEQHHLIRGLPGRPHGSAVNVAAARRGGKISSASASYPNCSHWAAIDEREKRDPAGAYQWRGGPDADLSHSATAASGNFLEIKFKQEFLLERIEIQGRLGLVPQHAGEHSRHQTLNIELFDKAHNEVWDYVAAFGDSYNGVDTELDDPPCFGLIDLTENKLGLAEAERTAKFLRITQTKPDYLVIAEVRAFGRQRKEQNAGD